MRYEKSAARADFERAMVALSGAIREAHSAECRSRLAREHVLCSAVLLASAAVESYLESVLGAWAKGVAASGQKTNVLPKPLRAFLLGDPALVSAIRRFIADEDEVGFLGRLSAALGRSNFAFAMDGADIPRFPHQVIYADRKYPSVKNIERLFFRLGIPGIFDQLNKSARSDLRLALRSFGDVRTELAHCGVPAGMTVADVREKLKGLARVVTHLDRVLHRHVCATTGVGTWPAVPGVAAIPSAMGV